MTKSELKYILSFERQKYRNYTFNSFRRLFFSWVKNDPVRKIMRWQYFARMTDYFHLKVKNGSKLAILPYLFYCRRRNVLAFDLSIEISTEKIGKGFFLFHSGATVINENAIIGENCRLHGNNCIGNNGTPGGKCPRIGNNVSIGVGAKIIGDIEIADNVVVAAGAVVINSIIESNVVVAGIPAKIVKRL